VDEVAIDGAVLYVLKRVDVRFEITLEAISDSIEALIAFSRCVYLRFWTR